MEEEIWKIYKISKNRNQYSDIPNVWEVSNWGRVKRNGKIYECKISNSGYLFFASMCLVQRAVATLFVENPNNYNEVDHIDGNKLNNYYLNLRWCSHKENMNNLITRKRNSESQKGKVCSIETRNKISESTKGERNPMYGRKGENAPHYGKKHSQSSKTKISNALKGRSWFIGPDGKRHWV